MSNIDSDRTSENSRRRPGSSAKEYLGGLLIGVCCAGILFFISRVENANTTSASPPTTTGQHAHP